jgi:PhoPQ-activated pathogenicity-related protein
LKNIAGHYWSWASCFWHVRVLYQHSSGATSALALVLFPMVSFVALWIYSLIFVFAALWFSHFLLDALKTLRQEELDKALTVPTRVIEAELPHHGE